MRHHEEEMSAGNYRSEVALSGLSGDHWACGGGAGDCSVVLSAARVRQDATIFDEAGSNEALTS
jgi:hypothetical protein